MTPSVVASSKEGGEEGLSSSDDMPPPIPSSPPVPAPLAAVGLISVAFPVGLPPVVEPDPELTSSEPDSADGTATAVEEKTAMTEDIAAEENPVGGKLRSSVADAEGNALARSYGRRLQETENFALDFMTREVHHPVITCFRELTRTDISTLVSNRKLKKSLNNLEQSVLYLGLIDLLATMNNNPFYSLTSGGSDRDPLQISLKFASVAGSVKKILSEFKAIIGAWALSGNEALCSRYSTIMSYLRRLAPMFEKANFDQEFADILDSIEKEVRRLKPNREKLRVLSSSFDTSRSSLLNDSQDGESVGNRSALNELAQNINLTMKPEDSDGADDEVTVTDVKTPQVFGKPLKVPKFSGRKKKKAKSNTPSGLLKSSAGNRTSSGKSCEKTADESTKSNVKPSLSSPATTGKPTVLASMFAASPKTQQSSKPNVIKSVKSKTPPIKRPAQEELSKGNGSEKKQKIETSNPVSNKMKESIPTSLASSSPSSSTTASCISSSSSPTATETPTKSTYVNAFAIMMKRSREMAQEKKLDKLNKTNNVRAVKVKT